MVHSLTCICYWLLHTCVWHEILHSWYLFQPLVISVNISSLSPVFFKNASRANFRAAKDWPGSVLYNSRQLFLKHWNTSARNMFSLCMYRSWYCCRIPSLLVITFFIEFILAIRIFIWINTFPQHETGFVKVSMTELICFF